jgi:hypothetical protein
MRTRSINKNKKKQAAKNTKVKTDPLKKRELDEIPRDESSALPQTSVENKIYHTKQRPIQRTHYNIHTRCHRVNQRISDKSRRDYADSPFQGRIAVDPR